MRLSVVALLAVLASVAADVYMQHPRGSNNRLNGQNRDRANNNRMFDSQNNNRGGYNVGTGGMFYYVGSKMVIEWTNQHQCGGTRGPGGADAKNTECEVIFQYMCSPMVRDGDTTKTIPNNRNQCANDNCNVDNKYGMHEDYDYYKMCEWRQRNKGLFTADQNVGNRAKNTRQNPNGDRRGYECPEERDYYPYWGPSPWKDIAILTTNKARCAYYKKESQNTKPKHMCIPPEDKPDNIPITKAECEATTPAGVWQEVAAHGIPEPACIDAPYSRDNHLGNGMGGHANTYNWTIPDDPQMREGGARCALRMRYNISTTDFDGWTEDSKTNEPANNNDGALTKILGNNLSADEQKKRGYVLKTNTNPQVKPCKECGDKFTLQLAVNTAQFSRTFQDRSHRWTVRVKPPGMAADAKIHNLNVRGKRGNIVQTYPGTEYDFVPNRLQIKAGDYVHPQWDGSNKNPKNNAGQGRAGTDRSNMVELTARKYPEGTLGAAGDELKKFGQWGNSYPQFIRKTNFMGLTESELVYLARTPPGDEFDDDSTYQNMEPRKVTKPGTYYYMCSRNNNFTNRSQKGKVVVNA